MTKEQKLMSLKVRRNILKGRGDKNMDSPGVLKKIDRQIRNIENSLS